MQWNAMIATHTHTGRRNNLAKVRIESYRKQATSLYLQNLDFDFDFDFDFDSDSDFDIVVHVPP